MFAGVPSPLPIALFSLFLSPFLRMTLETGTKATARGEHLASSSSGPARDPGVEVWVSVAQVPLGSLGFSSLSLHVLLFLSTVLFSLASTVQNMPLPSSTHLKDFPVMPSTISKKAHCQQFLLFSAHCG